MKAEVMKDRLRIVCVLLSASVQAGAAAIGSVTAVDATDALDDAAAGPAIHTGDVERFYELYDSAGGHPTAGQLQRDYIDRGSEGLHRFAKVRNITGARIAEALAENPQIYSRAKRCMAALPRVRQRLQVALRTLGRLYAEARLPPVTIAVGRGKPVGVGSPVSGIQIGLEALCATEWLNPDVEDRFVYVIAHEYAHVQQAPALVDAEHPTVLELSLVEGTAEFTAELISGDVAYSWLRNSTKGREQQIESAFVSDVDKTDLSDWLNNSTPEKPRDLGYWVGYRIVRAYYERASDKRQALREILEMTDPKAFLARSGWYPGIRIKSGHAPVNGIHMYYEVHGGRDGIPLVLLHGGGSTIEVTFSRVLPIFARSRTVIALEEQGHGRTTDRDGPFSFETSADDVAALLGYLKVNKADILGFSNGASVALQVAIRHPQLVRKLVFASSMTRRDGARPELWEFINQADFSNMPQPLKDAFLRVNPDVQQLRTMHDKDAARMRNFEDVPEDLVRSIRAPTLIVLGDQDVVKPEHALELARQIQGARLLMLPGGHGDYLGEALMTQSETRYPELTAGLIAEFLDSATLSYP